MTGSTDEADPKDWFMFAADRLRAADAVWQIEGFTYAGIELLHETRNDISKGIWWLINGVLSKLTT